MKFTKKQLVAPAKRVTVQTLFEVKYRTTWGSELTRKIVALDYLEVVKIVHAQFTPDAIHSITVLDGSVHA